MKAMNEGEMVVVPEIYPCDFVMHKEGNDMYSLGIRDGDMLYIRAQRTATLGDVVVIQVDGVALLRQVIIFDAARAVLQACPMQLAPPEEYAGSDREKVQIIGKVVGLARSLERTDAPNED